MTIRLGQSAPTALSTIDLAASVRCHCGGIGGTDAENGVGCEVMAKHEIALSIALLSCCAGPAIAKDDIANAVSADSRKADSLTVAEAQKLIAQKQSDKALEMLSPLLAQFDARIAQEQAKGMVFCGPSMTEGFLYSALGATKKQSSVVFGSEVCEAYFVRSYALTELGRKAEALASLQRLTGLAPMHAPYFVELGYAYRENGDNPKAEEAYRTAMEYAGLAENETAQKQARAAAQRGIGYILIEKGDLTAAKKAYEKSLKDDPDSPVAKSELAFIAEQRKK
ncbi:hypothetical protein WSK_1636 [Novosphingobium sp. Rr 2-17]|uniref:tetratricopeptide repeat protein n=1 Tax=Novosphingobium sp. Rr 2-17 TaxID=555793 RepID=UPI0002699E97|nr:tetratricopeptide repeat protein [Novosphingobium sp. Rr 2-17]EIZ79746.1 hypothetical protein WSK_1636 [Novosphingobium sp. Rr 2-17]